MQPTSIKILFRADAQSKTSDRILPYYFGITNTGEICGITCYRYYGAAVFSHCLLDNHDLWEITTYEDPNDSGFKYKITKPIIQRPLDQ